MAKLIYLSPSNHGIGNNPCLRSGCYEDKHTRPMAEAAAKYLRASGFRVIVAKASQSMAERCAEADREGAVGYFPIHTNASSSRSSRYLMFMCIRKSGEYLKMFNAIAPYLEAIYPEKRKAVFDQRTDLYEINVPNAKTFYCEMGFHTNKTDCDKFIHNADAIGKALAKGICKYYGVTFKGSNAEKPSSEKPSSESTKPFLVEIIVDKLNYRAGAGVSYKINGQVEKNEVYTITEVKNGWGKLKSGAGWINISTKYVKRI